MIVLSGARIITPTMVLDPGTLIVDGEQILDVQPGRRPAQYELDGHLIVPGFVDVHVHGVHGIDAQATERGVERMAAALPAYGVTAFCPTAVASSPGDLRLLLAAVSSARRRRPPHSARVLPAHLESNFINPEYRGAQPLRCLRLPPRASGDPERLSLERAYVGQGFNPAFEASAGEFTGDDVVGEIDAAHEQVGIVTLAPELPEALDLIRRLVDRGHRVSLGHSAATFEEGMAGIDAGARHATHLFNRMPPFSHHAPGLVGAIFDSASVTAELIVDGHHVHPAVGRAAIRALGPDRALAITDGTAVSGLPAGTTAALGSERLTAGSDVARLEDGTWAGSVLTMDGAFRNLVRLYGCGLVEAARLCSTNPACAVGEASGAIVPGGPADFVVLGPDLEVVQTFIAGVAVLGVPG